MDHDLRRALRAVADDPLARGRVAAILVRLGRIDPVQGDWLRDVAAQVDALRTSPLRLARSIRLTLGTEALAAGLVSLARAACASTQLPSEEAGRVLLLCSRALIEGLTADEQQELEQQRARVVERAAEGLPRPMLAAVWCLIRTTQAVERARSPWSWSCVPGILRSARAAMPGRGQACRMRGALVSGVLDLHEALDHRFPAWGTVWVEERPLSGRRRGGCAHALAGQTASYRLTLETGGTWRAVTRAIRRCCLLAGETAPRETTLARAVGRLDRLVEDGLHPVRALAVLEQAQRLLFEPELASIPEGTHGTWATPSDADGPRSPLRIARRRVVHARIAATTATLVRAEAEGEKDDLPF